MRCRDIRSGWINTGKSVLTLCEYDPYQVRSHECYKLYELGDGSKYWLYWCQVLLWVWIPASIESIQKVNLSHLRAHFWNKSTFVRVALSWPPYYCTWFEIQTKFCGIVPPYKALSDSFPSHMVGFCNSGKVSQQQYLYFSTDREKYTTMSHKVLLQCPLLGICSCTYLIDRLSALPNDFALCCNQSWARFKFLAGQPWVIHSGCIEISDVILLSVWIQSYTDLSCKNQTCLK